MPPRASHIVVALIAALVALTVVVVPLSVSGRIALVTTAAVFAGLWIRPGAPVEFLFLGGLLIVTLAGVISPVEAFDGFRSRAVLAIGGLFVAAAALRTTGVLDWVGQRLLGSAKTEKSALARLATMVPVSAIVLNTPLVAMLLPVVVDWCRQRNVSPSRMLIPLSYLVILGGVCTLIGTSTTLVINGILADFARQTEVYPPELLEGSLRELGFLEPAWVGVPCALIGVAYMLTIAPRLLPDRRDVIEELGQTRREYLLEMLVQPTCPLIGRTVEEAGLRSLPGLFLIEIDREGEVIAPVAPQDLIEPHDRMVFTGVVTTIADLERIPGLVPAADLTYEFHPAQRSRRYLTEAVLSRTSPLIGRTVREANFRRRYNAAVVAVHRGAERVATKIGDIRLQPGDTLLLQTRGDFVDVHRNNRDFYLVSQVGGSAARRHDRALPAGVLFGLLIVWLSLCSVVPALFPGWTFGNLLTSESYALAAMTVACAMVFIRSLTPAEARAAIDIQVLITIAAAIGLGKALDTSGAAGAIAQTLVDAVSAAGFSERVTPYVLLAVVYLLTMACTEAITNVAVASMMIPIAVRVALAGHYDPRPFILAITVSASLSFITPIGYQTNLMVMGPGGYRPADFARVGAPLGVLMFLTACVFIPMHWPFH